MTIDTHGGSAPVHPRTGPVSLTLSLRLAASA